ncbi:uncharacterized protein [Bemisia tabaci]|uniref:uncharacterized protein isoform X2 n=1 Tax=Bemisia tabaci TaxID=7038 RepID=UPI003B281A4B
MRHDQILLTVSIVLIHLLNLMRCKTTVDPEVDYGYELKRTPEQIKTELEKHKIIPDLLDKAPNETIHIEWMDRDGKWDRNGLCAKLGNEITRVHELECRPLWVNYRTFLKEVHTLMMIVIFLIEEATFLIKPSLKSIIWASQSQVIFSSPNTILHHRGSHVLTQP